MSNNFIKEKKKRKPVSIYRTKFLKLNLLNVKR